MLLQLQSGDASECIRLQIKKEERKSPTEYYITCDNTTWSSSKLTWLFERTKSIFPSFSSFLPLFFHVSLFFFSRKYRRFIMISKKDDSANSSLSFPSSSSSELCSVLVSFPRSPVHLFSPLLISLLLSANATAGGGGWSGRWWEGWWWSVFRQSGCSTDLK